MANRPLSGIPNKVDVPGSITPLTDLSLAPTHFADFGSGGLRTCATLTDRNNIPLARQQVGMLVYVEAGGGTYWRMTSTGATPTGTGNWEEFRPGGGELEVIPFNSASTGTGASWNPVNSDGDNTINLTHAAGTAQIEVEWYETGSNGTVFVPWSATDTTITGCVPSGNTFAGFVRVVGSSIASVTEAVNIDIPINGWIQMGSTETYTQAFSHGLGTLKPKTEVYETNGNEVLLEITIDDSTSITLTVFNNATFAGYMRIDS